MNSNWITVIGGIAAVLSTASFVPQAIKIIRSRDTSGISAGMYIVTVLGFALWTAYGVLQKAWPLVGSNSICLLLSAFILVMKLLPDKETEKVAAALEPVVGKDEAAASSAAA